MTIYFQKKLHKYVQSVAGKFAITVSLISLFVGLLAAVSIAYININTEEKDRVQMIDRMYLSSERTLLNSLWMMNIEVVETVLAGISNLPGVEEVTIITDNGDVIKKGNPLSRKTIKHEYPLLHSFQGENVSLGSLSITVGRDNIFNQISHGTKYLFLIIALIALAAGGLTVILFNRLVGQHLKTIAEHSTNLNFDNLNFEISLKRNKVKRSPDELEQITNAFNLMQERIRLDFEKREEAEEFVVEIKERLTKFMDSATDGFILFDSKFYHLEMNKAALEITGLTRQEVIGKNIIEVIPNIQKTSRYDSYIKVMETGKPYQVTELTHHPLTGDKYIELKAFKVGDGIGMIFNDVTERKSAEVEKRKLETRLQQSQKMESIGTLAGGIAHDFNNILAAILGYAEMAKDASQPGSAISEDLDEVLEAGIRAKNLVRQILAFSRQDDTERMVLQPASIVKETITMLRPSLPTTIEITQDIDAVTGPVFVDPSHLNQILMNLCTNAFHAMEETGGNLDISLKEVTLSSEDLIHEPDVADGTFIQFSISDSGPGIAPSIEGKIFDPFFTTKEVGKGTGMGLATVHGIVKIYGGFITLYSELGEGTVFHVFLPTVEQEALTEDVNNEQIPIGRESILFVDDEEILTKMGKTMLEKLGYHVTVRNNSLEALETFQNQPEKFDLVITDQTMPGMTGADLARRLIQIKPEIPIILCTGYSTIISEEKARAMGIKEFALKPLAKKDIAQLIRKVLDISFKCMSLK